MKHRTCSHRDTHRQVSLTCLQLLTELSQFHTYTGHFKCIHEVRHTICKLGKKCCLPFQKQSFARLKGFFLPPTVMAFVTSTRHRNYLDILFCHSYDAFRKAKCFALGDIDQAALGPPQIGHSRLASRIWSRKLLIWLILQLQSSLEFCEVLEKIKACKVRLLKT